MIIAIDFDGTIVKHDFPRIGEELDNAFDIISRFQEKGHKIILWTCRSGKQLDEAVEFCKINGLEFDAVNANITGNEFNSPKIYADWYIDDRANYQHINWLELYRLHSIVERSVKPIVQ